MLKFKTINAIAALLFVCLLGTHFFYGLPFIAYFLLLIGWLVITALGSFIIGWNYHIVSYNHNHAILKNFVAITFDDGPHTKYTHQVLEILKKYNAKATFFLIGKNAATHPRLVNQIIAEGHTIGNHTFSHSTRFGFFSTKRVSEELLQTNKTIQNITGLKLKMYRPAFGVTNPNIKKALRNTKLTPIGWSKRSFDTTLLSKEKILERLTKNLKKGDIILLHDTSSKSVAVLEQLLLFLKKNDLQPVTVDALLDSKPYV